MNLRRCCQFFWNGGPHAGHRPHRAIQHSLVLGDIRARRDHHRHADAVAIAIRHRQERLSRLAALQARNGALADAQPGKIHEMRGGEMAARGAFGSITAVSIHAAVCLARRPLAPSAPATWKRCARWPHIEAARLDRRPGRPTVTAHRILPDDRAGPRQSGLEGFAGRDLHADGHWRKARRAGELRAMFCGKTRRRILRSRSGTMRRLMCWRRLRRNSPGVSRKNSGARRSGPMRSRSTARSVLVRCAARMPDRFCSPA